MPREEYLSGDVRVKLEQTSSAAAGNAGLACNVRALEAVQPAHITPAEIKPALGAPWIPDDTQAFTRHLLSGAGVPVQHSPSLSDLRDGLDSDSALLGYAQGDERSYVCVVTRSGPCEP